MHDTAWRCSNLRRHRHNHNIARLPSLRRPCARLAAVTWFRQILAGYVYQPCSLLCRKNASRHARRQVAFVQLRHETDERRRPRLRRGRPPCGCLLVMFRTSSKRPGYVQSSGGPSPHLGRLPDQRWRSRLQGLPIIFVHTVTTTFAEETEWMGRERQSQSGRRHLGRAKNE